MFFLLVHLFFPGLLSIIDPILYTISIITKNVGQVARTIFFRRRVSSDEICCSSSCMCVRSPDTYAATRTIPGSWLLIGMLPCLFLRSLTRDSIEKQCPRGEGATISEATQTAHYPFRSKRPWYWFHWPSSGVSNAYRSAAGCQGG